MSIVVAVAKAGRAVMAADTQSTFGSKVLPPDNQASNKMRRIGASLLGRSGWGVYDNILDEVLDEKPAPELADAAGIFRFFNELWRLLHRRYAFVNDQAKRKDSPFGDLGGSFLVANRAGIFYVAPNLGVTRFERYFAIGTGADFALGALYQLHGREGDAERIARDAVATAIALNVQCGGDTRVLEVP